MKASFDAGASLVTIHGLSGTEAMKKLALLENELQQQRPFKILVVTILTSWDRQSLPANLHNWEIETHVQSLVKSARDSGLTGIVCSAHELEYLELKDLFVVTPGLQFQSTNEDQKRTMTPAQALKRGAKGLVVGRSILKAQDPRAKVQEILASLN